MGRLLTQLDVAQQKLVSASGKVAVARQERDTANSKWNVLQERFSKLQQALQGSENIPIQTNACRVAEETAQQAYEQRKRLVELLTQLQAANKTKGEAEGRLQEAERKVAQARAVMNTIEVAWYEGQAAILARRLSVDVPCPVCGSTHHPQPATSVHDLPSEESLKQSRDSVEQMTVSCNKARDELAKPQEIIIRLEATKKPLEESLGDKKHVSVRQLEMELYLAREARAKAEEHEKRIAESRRQVEDLNVQLSLARDNLTKAERNLQDVVNEQTIAQTLVDERKLAVPDNLQNLKMLTQAEQKAAGKVNQLAQLLKQAQIGADQANQKLAASEATCKQLSDLAMTARQRADEQREHFGQRIYDAGFADENEYRKAKRSTQAIDTLDQEIRTFEGKLQAARDRADRARKAAETLVKPDLPALRTASIQAK